MKNLLLIITVSVLLFSCGSRPKTTSSKKEVISVSKNKKGKASNIVNYAKSFQGTRYKFGGTTKKGMDCSGLVYVSFKSEKIALPRVSRDMAKKGKRIPVSKAKKGDLVFFKTNKNRNVINHVGLVVENKQGELFFIHATTSKGVIVSSLHEKYWKRAFVEVRRVI